MTKYIDGYVLVVPKKNALAYKKMAEEGREIWLKCGALDYYECIGDDLIPQSMGGESTRNFMDMAGAKSGEDVWFSFVTFKSKMHRDKVNAKVMQEMDKLADKYKDFSMPFDMKRMAYGGFKVVVGG